VLPATRSWAAPAPVPVPASSGTGLGFWEAFRSGLVTAAGDAPSFPGFARDRAGIVGIATLPDGKGYWLAGADGRVFAFGAARQFGSMGGHHLNRPIVGIGASPTGRGYVLTAADGGVFTFGDARYRGSLAGHHLHAPIVGMGVTESGKGYWLVGGNGRVYPFGDAHSYGDASRLELSAPVVGMAPTRNDRGYWLAGSDGAVYSYGNAHYRGNAMHRIFIPVTGIATSATGNGYLVLSKYGQTVAFGDAPACFGNFIRGPIPIPIGKVPNGNSTAGIAIPFNPGAGHNYLAASCGGLSAPFHASAPWHIDVTTPNSQFGFYCQILLLRAGAAGPGENNVLEAVQVQQSARLEMRAAQMQGGTTFQISTQGNCLALARAGSGGTQPLPFTITDGGDSLPFTSSSPITITGSSAFPCQVEVFSDSNGAFVDGHFGNHALLTVPPGSYFLQTDYGCNITAT
jgi:hypothetical protein